MMSSKVFLLLLSSVCLLGSCSCANDTTVALSRQEGIHVEPSGVHSVPDINNDPGFWRFWRFWSWGRSMLNAMLMRSSDMDSGSLGRHRIHQDRPKQKLKNKVKFLFKIHQYETDIGGHNH